jgi:sulfonate transport system substrate-binding protein
MRRLKAFIMPSLAALALTVAAILAMSLPSAAQEKTLRIGYQKYGTLILQKSRGTLEEKLKPLGFKVMWTEFPAGPQLLEALNVGAIDFGHAGEAPPIFAQAAGAPLVYVAHEPPAPLGEAILVPKDSPIKSVADLKGKKIALNKGSNVHYLLVKALEKAGVAYSDVQPQFLTPADARAAFERGSVDAWVIWDPFQAAAEAATGARTLADGTGLVSNYQFYFGARKLVSEHPKILEALLADINDVDIWAKGNIRGVAKQLSPAVGIPAEVLEVALGRQSYGVKPLDDQVVADQQKVADTFHKLGLIPKAINVSEAVWRPGT